MNKSSQHKDRYGNNGEHNQDNSNDGTSARTRPLSYEYIMLRRKSKKTVGVIHSGLVEEDNREDIDEKAADSLQSDKDRQGKSTRGSSRTEDSLKVSSRGREDNISMTRERKLAEDRARESQDGTETKSKLAPGKSLTHDNARRGKSDRHVNHKKRSDQPNEDSKGESGERHSRDCSRREISTEKNSRRSEKERELKESNDNNDRPVNKRRNVDHSRHDYENELHKRHSRSLSGAGKSGGHRVQSVKERKKIHHDEDRQKIEDRDGFKKLDMRASKSSEFSERKEKESSRMHYEESRLKRRRSRSRERDTDRGRRSPSLSPKVHKHASFTEQEHGGLSSHSSKDRSQRSHSDVERKRILSNGSNSNYRRYSGSSSGLGGYSPRKKKTDASAKTSSPSNHSPERRTAGWDLPPVGKDGNSTGPVVFGMQSSSQITSSNAQWTSDAVLETSFIVKPVIMPQYTSSQIHAIDSIQLTQATRPMRRLYVENIPASASEKALMECINNFLLSSGVNHVHGTLPCISCMIHKEKGQALLEFLTPEDASAALSFDGRSFSGSIIKIRRPKDFIDVTTGVPEKSVDANNTFSDTVEDSSHKIFIGGISKLISSEMLIDIARAFGPVKAFHFEHNVDIDAPCAFLEYADHLVTLKACAGLNGMKLGGQMLTVVQAHPDASPLGDASHRPFYGIPDHAKPLLEKPTEILKIKNVLDPEGIPSLSEAELEEILEDIRLECSRFGTVKAVNVVKPGNFSSTTESFASMDVGGAAVDDEGNQEVVTDKNTGHELENLDESKPPNGSMEAVEDNGNSDDKPGMSNPLSSSKEPDNFNEATVLNGDSFDKLLANIITDETCESSTDDRDTSVKNAGSLKNSGSSSEEHAKLPNSSKDQLVSNDEVVDTSATVVREIEDKMNIEQGSILEGDNARSVSASTPNPSETKDSDIHEKAENKEEVANLGNIFEAGSVLVEFKRAEASCMAAHCLHRRLFDERIVTVEYVAPNLYCTRFPK